MMGPGGHQVDHEPGWWYSGLH